MKIYTKTGDEGETGLFAGPRVAKDHPRIEAYGTVDELNAALGLARSAGPSPQLDQLLDGLQNDLFALGAELATPDPQSHGTVLLGPERVEQLERQIDQLEEQLPALSQFILPGGSPVAAALHLARGMARRAERRVVTLARGENPISPRIVHYLNRLGDLLFVLARYANQQAGQPDRPWRKPG